MKYAFIRRHASAYPVAAACRVLGVSRSGYHAALSRPESERARADRELTALIAQAHAASRHTYGAPRIHAELRARGVRVGRGRVARLMHQAGLRGACPPRHRRRQRAEAASATLPDLLERRFAPEVVSAPNRVWCADIKQVWTQEGWLFLAAVIDLYSRRIVGHAYGAAATNRLVKRALDAGIGRRRPSRGLIHHSDRGAAYLSGPFVAVLEAAGARQSLSRPGTPLDNAVQRIGYDSESFFSTLEREVLVRWQFATQVQARSVLFEYIEVFYNRQRRHSSLGYISPVAFEARASTIATTGVSTNVG